MLEYFERISEKHGLSNKSSDEEPSKKLRWGILDHSACSDVSGNNEDLFTEKLKSPECVSILMNCMQNLEKQVGQFDEYGKDWRKKCAIVANLQSKLKSASMKFEDLEKKMERQEQYFMRNCILIHGLKEEKN